MLHACFGGIFRFGRFLQPVRRKQKYAYRRVWTEWSLTVPISCYRRGNPPVEIDVTTAKRLLNTDNQSDRLLDIVDDFPRRFEVPQRVFTKREPRTQNVSWEKQKFMISVCITPTCILLTINFDPCHSKRTVTNCVCKVINNVNDVIGLSYDIGPSLIGKKFEVTQQGEIDVS